MSQQNLLKEIGTKLKSFQFMLKKKKWFTFHNKWSPHPLYSLSTSYIVAKSVPWSKRGIVFHLLSLKLLEICSNRERESYRKTKTTKILACTYIYIYKHIYIYSFKEKLKQHIKWNKTFKEYVGDVNGIAQKLTLLEKIW